MIEIYTDGACSGNPGPGGWGAVILDNGQSFELSGFEEATTNNRMELMAAISALESLTEKTVVALYTDSNYVKSGITQWISSWKAKDWKKADNEPVKNVDLWQRLDAICQKHQVSWHWVKGHSGHPGNERADFLARNIIAMTSIANAVNKG